MNIKYTTELKSPNLFTIPFLSIFTVFLAAFAIP